MTKQEKLAMVYDALKNHYHGEVAPRNLGGLHSDITYSQKLRLLGELVKAGKAVKIAQGVHARYKAI